MGALNLLSDRGKEILQRFAFASERHFQRGMILSYKDIKLTAAQLNTLNATPVALLPAPGAGKVNLVSEIFTYIDAGATPFEAGSATLAFRYTDGSGAEVATAVTNAALESASDTYYTSPKLACVPVVNAAVVAAIGTDISAGDGAVYIRVWYRIAKIAEVSPTVE